MQRIIVYNGCIGSYDALKFFMRGWSVFRDATPEEMIEWYKLNK